MSSLERPTSQPDPTSEWKSAILATDGSVRNNGQDTHPNETALGYHLQSTTGDTLTENSIYLGTNNNTHNCEAEALAILAGLYAARNHNITAVYLHTDAKVIVDYLNNDKTITSTDMLSVLEPISRLLDEFTHTTIKHVERNNTLITTVHDLAHDAFPE